jgi:hypothetical protein
MRERTNCGKHLGSMVRLKMPEPNADIAPGLPKATARSTLTNGVILPGVDGTPPSARSTTVSKPT